MPDLGPIGPFGMVTSWDRLEELVYYLATKRGVYTLCHTFLKTKKSRDTHLQCQIF